MERQRANHQRARAITRPGQVGHCLFVVVVALVVAPHLYGQLTINEFLAGNDAGLADPQGERDDWIEIYNAGGVAVDLGGMFISDDLLVPMKHEIATGSPGETTVPAGGYLVLWADNDVADGALHVGFKLGADGEAIGLYDSGGTLVDSVTFDQQQTDVSFGRVPDGGAEWRLFTTPSPGAANSGGSQGQVDDTSFSHDRGFYDAPFSVTISCATPNAVIHYTTDGTEPDETDAVAGAAISITTTTTLRARAFRSNWLASNTDTQTYVFTSQVASQAAPAGYPAQWGGGYDADYSMDPQIYNAPAYSSDFIAGLQQIPTISLVTNPDHLFDSSTGIYMNTNASGETWERPVSVEYMDPASGDTFQLDAGFRIQGGASRQPNKSPKHSFRLLFKQQYGPSKLNFPLFGDYAADSFDTIVLRGGFNNSWIHWNGGQRAKAQYMRDQWTRETQLAMGQASPHGRYVHLYLNGLYWGLYNPCERPQASFGVNYFGGEKEEWDALNSGEAIDGNKDAWNAAQAIANAGINGQADYDALAAYVDIPNLIDYMIVQLFGSNQDWDHHNWYAGRHRVAGAGYRFFSWDTERIFESVSSNKIGVNNNGSPSRFYTALRQNAGFRRLFGDHVHRHLFNDGVLTPQSAIARWSQLHASIDLAVIAESARWGDYRRDVHSWSSGPYELYSKNDFWLVEHQRLIDDYLPYRTANFLNQLRAADLYPDVDAPTFKINGLAQHGGVVPVGATLEITAPAGTIYYTLDGSDPMGVGGGGDAAPLSQTISDSVRVRARAWDGAWSALNEAVYVVDAAVVADALRVSELMYHPRRADSPSSYNDDDFAFIELHNSGAHTLDVGGVAVTNGVSCTIGRVFDRQEQVLLGPGAYMVLVENAEAFHSRYGSSATVVEYAGAFDAGGERVTIVDAADQILASFVYSDGRGWPCAADGGGHSLVPLEAVAGRQATGALNYGRHWRLSTYVDGSPGEADPAPPAGVVINEFAAHTDYPLPPPNDSNDWAELYNPTGATVTLNDYFLSDDLDQLDKWQIPNGTAIAAGGFLVLDEVTNFNVGGAGFGLSKDGEELVLAQLPSSGGARIVDCIRFKGQENGPTLGRYPDGGPFWRPMAATRNAPNTAGIADIIISEVMYSPADGSVACEYLELVNPTDQAVPLWTPMGPWRINGDVDFVFPPSTTLPAHSVLLVTSFDPTDTVQANAFKSAYGLAAMPPHVFGPYSKSLPDEFGRVALERAQEPDSEGASSWVVVDEVIYLNQQPFPDLRAE